MLDATAQPHAYSTTLATLTAVLRKARLYLDLMHGFDAKLVTEFRGMHERCPFLSVSIAAPCNHLVSSNAIVIGAKVFMLVCL